jgi:hypothetical protein
MKTIRHSVLGQIAQARFFSARERHTILAEASWRTIKPHPTHSPEREAPVFREVHLGDAPGPWHDAYTFAQASGERPLF